MASKQSTPLALKPIMAAENSFENSASQMSTRVMSSVGCDLIYADIT